MRGASSAGASEFLPSVWRDRIAFARVYERRRGRAGKRAHLYVRSLGRGGINRSLPAGPRSRRRACAFPPPRSCRRVIEPGPTAIDLAQRHIAFAWDSTDVSVVSEVYFERIRAGRIVRHLVARGSSGDMTTREYLVAHIDAQGRAAWILSMHGNLTLAEVGRYTIRTGKRQVAQLQPLAGDPVIRTVARRRRGRLDRLLPRFRPGADRGAAVHRAVWLPGRAGLLAGTTLRASRRIRPQVQAAQAPLAA